MVLLFIALNSDDPMRVVEMHVSALLWDSLTRFSPMILYNVKIQGLANVYVYEYLL